MATNQEIDAAFAASGAGHGPGVIDYGAYQGWSADKVQEDVLRKFGTATPTDTIPENPTGSTPTDPLPAGGTPTTVVPGNAEPGTGQIGVQDVSGAAALDPSLLIRQDDPNTPENESMSLGDHVPNIDGNAQGTNLNPADPRYGLGENTVGQAAQGTTAQGTAVGASGVDPKRAVGYTAATTQKNVEKNGQMAAAKGTLSKGSIIDESKIPQIDLKAATSKLGLDDYAHLEIKDVAKEATLKGQLEILQSEFVDAQGNPKIPAWAAGAARNTARIATFKGMTGTAATAAMAQAIMEASIPVASEDAKFFQTLTLQNLSNKQQSIINKANILAKFELANLDNRMAAAVTNAQSFLQMDLANLNNEQQARVVNVQARVQSILEDAKAVNTARMFTADAQNEQNRFYDQLNASIEMFTASQMNRMSEFNVGQANQMEAFNVGEFNTMERFRNELENNREQFESSMQYNIDISNARWRQTVTLTGAEMSFEAASRDVQNLVGISQEQMNGLWDRYDSNLDYLFTATENELDRRNLLALERLKADAAERAADSAGFGTLVGTISGALINNISDATKAAGDFTEWLGL